MINTNLLISIGFAIITNFVQHVPIPDANAPKAQSDLTNFRVGSPHSPLDLAVRGPSESLFVIIDGSVQYFKGSHSFFREQDPSRIAEYAGSAVFTSNEIVGLASNVLQSLLKDSVRLTCGPLRVQQGGIYNGRHIPFYLLEWPTISFPSTSTGAEIDVDARNGKIVLFHALDPAFLDFKAAESIRNLVYVPDTPFHEDTSPPVKQRSERLPRPETNQLVRVMTNWQSFCRALGLDQDVSTNTVDVDWDNTCIALNEKLSGPCCKLRLHSGAGCLSMDGTIFAVSTDTGYNPWVQTQMSKTEFEHFRGRIVYRWEDLSNELEYKLIHGLGFPSERIAYYRPNARYKPPVLGSVDIKRVSVDWRHWPSGIDADHPGRNISLDESTLGFGADFDVETGQLKAIEFYDKALVDLLSVLKQSAPIRKELGR